MFLIFIKGEEAGNLAGVTVLIWCASLIMLLVRAPFTFFPALTFFALMASLITANWMVKHRESIAFRRDFAGRLAFPDRQNWPRAIMLSAVVALFYLVPVLWLASAKSNGFIALSLPIKAGLFLVTSLGSLGVHGVIHLLWLRRDMRKK
ncbi:hypothetical protein [Celeribacter persicus]|jgi:hypothetical protein|uniref:Uncharacterized protein n=1 Tax=Celeribacter persicus TaxID=1651082 RepID=A0A2T5HUB7_9RHOB|nr:hypothetical protein [Celeribacter persicus]PTQ75182.1 hypothetical protein C8N42_10298 [Celeribacter persicus]